VGFFWDRLNVHTFNCHRRADRRVEGWLRRDGWAEGWVEEWVDRWAEGEGKGGV
jgi:hypothetical protein